MPPEVGEVRSWLLKARSDWYAARTLLVGIAPETDVAAFHCQQAVEKLLKAYLVAKGIEFEKIHDLRRLIGQCAAADAAFGSLREAVRPLTAFAVAFRYPGLPSVAPDEVREALAVVRTVWFFVTARLPADAVPPAVEE